MCVATGVAEGDVVGGRPGGFVEGVEVCVEVALCGSDQSGVVWGLGGGFGFIRFRFCAVLGQSGCPFLVLGPFWSGAGLVLVLFWVLFWFLFGSGSFIPWS